MAAVDVHFRGNYAVNDIWWRNSELCSFAGFLSMFSGELSVATLTVITVDRYIAIALNFQVKKLGLHQVKLILVAVWTVTLVICLAPYFHDTYFGNFFGQTEMCLPVPIASDRQAGAAYTNATHRGGITAFKQSISSTPSGWEYSVFVFVGVNGLSFLTIFFLYIRIFIYTKRTRAAVQSVHLKKNLAVARKMLIILGTDAACWLPVIGLGLYCLQGNDVGQEVT